MFLDIESRAPRQQGAIIIGDKLNSNINLVCYLNQFPYPFKDNSFRTVRIWDYLEHLDDIIKVIEEIHRILKPDGMLKIMVPHFSNYYAFTDPTHKHFFGIKTMDYFMPHTKHYRLGYTTAKYKKIQASLGLVDKANGLKKIILKLINRFPEKYERRFAFIFPIAAVYYELQVIK